MAKIDIIEELSCFLDSPLISHECKCSIRGLMNNKFALKDCIVDIYMQVRQEIHNLQYKI